MRNERAKEQRCGVAAAIRLALRHPQTYYAEADRMVYTTGQVAAWCGVAPRTVSKWVDRGYLKGFRIPLSDDRRVPRESLVAFMERLGLQVPVTLRGLQERPQVALVQGLPEAVVQGCLSLQEDKWDWRQVTPIELAAEPHGYDVVVLSLSLGLATCLELGRHVAAKRAPLQYWLAYATEDDDGSALARQWRWGSCRVQPWEECSWPGLLRLLQEEFGG